MVHRNAEAATHHPPPLLPLRRGVIFMAARNLALPLPWERIANQSEIPRFARNDTRPRFFPTFSGLLPSPLGERVARRPDALHREAGRVRGSQACVGAAPPAPVPRGEKRLAVPLVVRIPFPMRVGQALPLQIRRTTPPGRYCRTPWQERRFSWRLPCP